MSQADWNEIEGSPQLLERGPRNPERESPRPIPFTTVIDGDTQIAVVDAESAYDATQRAFAAKLNHDVVVIVGNQVTVVVDAESASEAVKLALKPPKRKRTIKKKSEEPSSEATNPRKWS